MSELRYCAVRGPSVAALLAVAATVIALAGCGGEQYETTLLVGPVTSDSLATLKATGEYVRECARLAEASGVEVVVNEVTRTVRLRGSREAVERATVALLEAVPTGADAAALTVVSP
jgi:hypothetical protein